MSRGPGQTKYFGRLVGAEVRSGDLLLLEGAFGAGKTTFVQGLAEGAGAHDRVNSPSFTLINEYHGRLPIFHVDLFRLKELDIEMEQALESCEEQDGVTIVEWPALLPGDLREGALTLEMAVLGDMERSIVLHSESSRWDASRIEMLMKATLRGRPQGESDR